MKKILIATDSFHKYPTANGICVEEIARELVLRKYEVHVLCFRHPGDKINEMINEIHIHRLKMDLINKLRFKYETKTKSRLRLFYKYMMILVNRIKAVLFIHWFPMRSPFFANRYLRMMKKINDAYCFDAIISSYCPFEAAFSLMKIKKENSNLKLGIYMLDSLTNLNKRFFMSERFQEKKAWRWEEKIFEKADFIINMRCHRRHYTKEKYTRFAEKMYFSDIPHIINHDNLIRINHEKNKPLRMIYAGFMRNDILEKVITLLSPFLKNNRIQLELYGRSTYEMLNRICDKSILKNIFIRGFVQHEEILVEEYNSNILLSLGNANTDFIPSKTFEYISLGKKILHIYSYEKDPTLYYYGLYPNSCCINVNDELNNNIEKINNFLEKDEIEIKYDSIKEIFLQNTPEFTVDIIEKYITK